jgi:hypothetical protein
MPYAIDAARLPVFGRFETTSSLGSDILRRLFPHLHPGSTFQNPIGADAHLFNNEVSLSTRHHCAPNQLLADFETLSDGSNQQKVAFDVFGSPAWIRHRLPVDLWCSVRLNGSDVEEWITHRSIVRLDEGHKADNQRTQTVRSLSATPGYGEYDGSGGHSPS